MILKFKSDQYLNIGWRKSNYPLEFFQILMSCNFGFVCLAKFLLQTVVGSRIMIVISSIIAVYIDSVVMFDRAIRIHRYLRKSIPS